MSKDKHIRNFARSTFRKLEIIRHTFTKFMSSAWIIFSLLITPDQFE